MSSNWGVTAEPYEDEDDGGWIVTMYPPHEYKPADKNPLACAICGLSRYDNVHVDAK